MIKKNFFWKFANIFFFIIFLFLFAFFCYLTVKSILNKKNIDIFLSLFFIYSVTAIFAVYLFLQERHMDAKIPWLLLIIFLPLIGPILYLVYGRKYRNVINKTNKNFIIDNNIEIYDKDQKEIFNNFSNIFKRNVKNFNSETFFNGYLFFKQLINDMENAKKYIFIEIFIIKNHFIWNKIRDVLIKKAKEGIEIRMILDSFGTSYIKRKEWKELEKLGINIIFYNKIYYPFIHSNNFYRIHKKIFLIDGKISYIGGNNISDEYNNFSKKYGIWFDTNLKVTGNVVLDILESFIFDWNKWSKNKIENLENYLEKNIDPKISSENLGILFEGGPDDYESLLETALINLIYKAKNKIQIFTPYFVPTKRIFLAIKEALLTKKEIEVFLPGKYDKKYVKWFTEEFSTQLEELGAKIYEYKNIFSHTKALIIDEKIGYTGTMNLDVRSLYSQYEINLLISGKFVSDFIENLDYLKRKKIINEKKNNMKKNKKLFKKFLIDFFKSLL